MKRNKNRIYVIGYGMKGNLSGLTIEAYRIIKNSTHIYCRVDCDPIFGQLKKLGKRPVSLYKTYREKLFQFKNIYEGIALYLIEEARKYKQILYLVPGHPLVCETPTENLINLSKKSNFNIVIIPGVSFMDAIFTELNFDPGYGFQMFTASQFYDKSMRRIFSPSINTMISCISHIPQQGLIKTEYEVTINFLNEIYPPHQKVIILFSSLFEYYKLNKEVTIINKLQHLQDIITKNRATLFIPSVEKKKVLT